ncbi:transposase, partial [Streptodolium elevatio]
VLSDRAGLPLVVGLSAGNCHDSNGLKPLVQAFMAKHDPDRGRPWKPGKLHADKAYDNAPLRKWLRGRRIVRIARIGIDTSQRLGRHRWAVERTMSWLTGYRRLTIRYERRSDLFLALLTLAAAALCCKRLHRHTT